MDCKLLKTDNDVWNLFIPTVSKPSQASLFYLARYLRCHDLPELCKPQYLANVIEGDVIDKKYPLRYLLIDWLLPAIYGNNELLTGISEAKQASNKPISIELLAQILVTLIKRDSKMTSADQIAPEQNEWNDRFQSVEEMYIVTNFDSDLGEIRSDKVLHCSVKGNDVSIVSSLETKLCDLLIRDCNQVIESSNKEVRILH